MAPDLLHQVIKGTFKDHLVEWVMDYLWLEHGETRALEIIADIDRRCVGFAPPPGMSTFQLTSPPEFLLYPYFLDCVALWMGATLLNGRGMTQKR